MKIEITELGYSLAISIIQHIVLIITFNTMGFLLLKLSFSLFLSLFFTLMIFTGINHVIREYIKSETKI